MLDKTKKHLLETVVWAPDYPAIFLWRQERLKEYRADPEELFAAREYYRTRPVEFILHWCDTFDPRVMGGSSRMPFVLFKRQVELIEFLLANIEGETNGLVEKCRDMGATWVCVAFSVWMLFFCPGASIGWGSRKQDLVDRIGDMDSIFEKIRWLILSIPRDLWPIGFSEKNMSFMKVWSDSLGTSITGESGDDIGRGGRKRIYFKDESAHYEHPDKIEAALDDNTRVQIDISSVNGLGNVFHRKRETGKLWTGGKTVRGQSNILIMDWRDHPLKTQQWYDDREREAKSKGLLYKFRQEVDRNYAASVDGVIIDAAWVQAAIDAHLKIPGMTEGGYASALDVADGGTDTNAQAVRKGVALLTLEEWGERDTGMTARRAISNCSKYGDIELFYDCIGVGSGVKSETNRLRDENEVPEGIDIFPWDAGAGPINPDARVVEGDDRSPINKDFYANLKAQGWWMLARRFELTYRVLTEGIKVSPDELISLSSQIPLIQQLQKELSQPTRGLSGRMKMLVNKTPDGTKSPNLADAVMMCYMPVRASDYVTSLSWV